MNTVLTAVSKVYETTGTVTIARVRLPHPALRQFHRNVTLLTRLIQEQEADKDLMWQDLERRLKRFRFLSAATPLPFNHPFLWDGGASALLKRAIGLAAITYPSLTGVIGSLAKDLEALRDESTNPLLNAIQGHLEQVTAGQKSKGRWAVLLADGRSVALVEAVVASVPQLEIVTASQLKENTSFADLLVLGSSSWFPEYCFTASRAERIYLLQYNWSWDNPSFGSAFVSGRQGSKVDWITEPANTISGSSSHSEQELLEINPPDINWTLALQAGRSAVGGGGIEEVGAHLYLLEGGHGVWFEDAPGTTALTIALASTGDNVVRRQDVSKLLAGEFVLLRSGGGGDLIVSVANRVLGQQCERLRGVQNEWKKNFRRRSSQYSSIEAVCRELRRHGCKRASGQNIRNWMSERTIKPDSDEDFRAVLSFCGLGARHAEIGQAMEQIASAHQSAGRRISIMILKAVSAKDTTPLRREGVQVFELPQGEGGGSFTAYRVLARSEDTIPVPPHRLSQVFKLET